MKYKIFFFIIYLPISVFSQQSPYIKDIINRSNDSIHKIENINYSSYVRYKTRTRENFFGDKFAMCWMEHAPMDTFYGYRWRIDQHGITGREGLNSYYYSDTVWALWPNQKITEIIIPDKLSGNTTLFMERQYSLQELYWGIPTNLKELNAHVPNFVQRDSMRINLSADSSQSYLVLEISYREIVKFKDEKHDINYIIDKYWINRTTYLPEKKGTYTITFWGDISYDSIHEINVSNFRINKEEIKKEIQLKIPDGYEIKYYKK